MNAVPYRFHINAKTVTINVHTSVDWNEYKNAMKQKHDEQDMTNIIIINREKIYVKKGKYESIIGNYL